MLFQCCHVEQSHAYLDNITPVVDESIAANEYPHILSVCEVEDGLAQLSSAHS